MAEEDTNLPLAPLAEAEDKLSARLESDDHRSAAERIRAFEDEHLGKDAVRINGRVERGSGSPYAEMSAELKHQYAALGKLEEAEQKLAAAHSALILAEEQHQAALAAAESKPDAAAHE